MTVGDGLKLELEENRGITVALPENDGPEFVEVVEGVDDAEDMLLLV